MTFDDSVADRRTMDAVVRRLTIIGEAAARVPEFVCEKYRYIPWAEMRAMRNFIVHEYFGISEQILWETLQMDLPAIVGPLEALLVSGKEADETWKTKSRFLYPKKIKDLLCLWPRAVLSGAQPFLEIERVRPIASIRSIQPG